MLVVVCTMAGDVLMLERKNPAGYWQSVTGSLEWGEDPATAAARELYEETGLQLPVIDCHHSNTYPLHPAWRERYDKHVTGNLEHVYRVVCNDRPAIVLNDREHLAYRWLDRDAAAGITGSPTNRSAILKFVPPSKHSE